MANQRVIDVLIERLKEWGVQRVYGEALGDLIHIAVQQADLAVLLADADGRIGHHDGSGRLGAAFLQDRILHLSSQPGGTSSVYSIQTPDDLVAALHTPVGIDIPNTMALHLDIDLETPVAADLVAAWQPEQRPVVTLNESLAGLNVMLIAGPGVVRAWSVDQLQQCVRQGGFGVLNTFGAKGVERWDSPYYLGTGGLQVDDWKHAGCFDADVILTSGIDPLELPPAVLSHSVVQDVPSTQLQALTRSWPKQAAPDKPSPLIEKINAITHPLVESNASPLNPARASLHLAGVLPEGGVVVADPGRAGWWIARTLPTGIAGSCVIPALDGYGFAAAAALVCALEGRAYVAVTDLERPSSQDAADLTAQVIELADSLQKPIALQAWGESPEVDDVVSSPDGHVALLQQSLADPLSDSAMHSVVIDFSAERDFHDALGERIPWTI